MVQTYIYWEHYKAGLCSWVCTDATLSLHSSFKAPICPLFTKGKVLLVEKEVTKTRHCPQSLQTIAWRPTKSQALSTLSSMATATHCCLLPSRSFHNVTDAPGHPTLPYWRATENTCVRTLSPQWQSPLPHYLQDHGRFAQGHVSGSCDLWKLCLAEEMCPTHTAWTIFKR